MTELVLTAWLRALAGEIQRTKPDYPLNVVHGCPIPFFGNVLQARVLTVGVNPSSMEFSGSRDWRQPLEIPDWQKRLLSYFNWPAVPAHDWFDTFSICVELLGTSYAAGSAAHLDISPRPTTAMIKNAKTNQREFRAMVEHDVKWFFDLLGKLPQVQLLLVAGPIPRANGGKQQLADFIRGQAGSHRAEWREGDPLPRLVTPSHPKGIPVFVCPYEPELDGLYAMVRQVYRHRELLRRLSAPGPGSVPILPARLDWPSAVGQFLLNYGILDYFVFVFLKDHLSPDEFACVEEWHLNDRVRRISQLLKDKHYPPGQQAAFARLLERLAPVREFRNHIAHGHMYLRLDAKTRAPTVTLFKAKDLDTGLSPDSEHVRFEQLQAALATLTELIEEFQTFAGFKNLAPPSTLNS
jgi:hypothetical protein